MDEFKTALETESDMLEMAKTDKEDMVFLSYTSGTTGNPKGVVHTHAWAYAHLRTSAQIGSELKRMMLCGQQLVQAGRSGFGVRFSNSRLGATGFVYHGKFEPKRI